ncbi:MAG: acyl carrier protein [Nostocaceae cyanobacterium]|nr:acyl carrier protein [Nostocaceae cyanobacterium]
MENSNVEISTMPIESTSLETDNKTNGNQRSITVAEIQQWIVAYIAQLLNISEQEIDVTVSFDRYGLDSLAAIGLSGKLGSWLEYEIDPTVLYDYPTIETLTQYLAEELRIKA